MRFPTLGLALAAATAALAADPPATLQPSTMPRLGAVDERFQSYNIEMVEVTGGRFWKPYNSKATTSPQPAGATPAGVAADQFEYRPPIDLSNARLRKLASALGPAYVRVSGTWANTVYFHDSDDPAPAQPPTGFGAVLTRQQWRGVVDFVRATNGALVTSFAFGAGNRDASGAWIPDQARRVIDFTRASGGRIAAAEFVNEPNLATMGGAPKGYDAAAYGRDVTTFRRFFREVSPGSLFVGPGSVGEGSLIGDMPLPGKIDSADLLKATGPVFDVFSDHIYPAVSQRCAAAMPAIGTTAAAALTDEWLARPDKIHAFYAVLRDRYQPGAPIWVTETAGAACGGNAWAVTYRDSFRYLIQNARLAQQGVHAIMHNTLAASDYGLLDEKTYAPRPDYWAALLWGRLMGSVVLKPAPVADLYLYAHCTRDQKGSVTVLAINTGAAPRDVNISAAAQRYTLSAPTLDSDTVQLNGKDLVLGSADALPALDSISVSAGRVTLAPASITFLTFPTAANKSCY